MAGKFGSSRSAGAGIKEALADNLDCGTFCEQCKLCRTEEQQRAKDIVAEIKKNPGLKGQTVASMMGVDVQKIGQRNRILTQKSQEYQSEIKPDSPKAEKEEKQGDKKPLAAESKKAEVKAEKSEKTISLKEEIKIGTKKEDDLIYKGKPTPLELQKPSGTQLNNTNDIFKYQIQQNQNGTVKPANDYSQLAARTKAADQQADFFKKQSVPAALNQPQALTKTVYSKLQELISHTIQQATYMRNKLTDAKQEAAVTQKKAVQMEMPPKFVERLKQIERAIDTVIKHSWQKITAEKQTALRDAQTGIKIINNIKPENRNTPLHRETVRQNLRSVEKALALLKPTQRAVKPAPLLSKSVKLEARMVRKTAPEKVIKQNTRANVETQRRIKMRPTAVRSEIQQQRRVRLEPGKPALTKALGRQPVTKIITRETLVKPVQEKTRLLKSASPPAVRQVQTAERSVRSRHVNGEVMQNRTSQVKVLEKTLNKNVNQKREEFKPKQEISRKLNIVTIQRQGLVPTLRANVVHITKNLIEKYPVVATILKEANRVKEIVKVQVVAKAVNFVRGLLSKKVAPKKEKRIAVNKNLIKKKQAKIKAKKDAVKLFKFQLWMESLQKKKKFRVPGYKNGAPKELTSPLGKPQKEEDKDFMEDIIPVDEIADGMQMESADQEQVH